MPDKKSVAISHARANGCGCIMTDRLTSLQYRYQRLLGKKEQLKTRIDTLTADIQEKTKLGTNLLAAQTVVRELADQARQEFKSEVDRLVTLAIRSVFSENFSFDLQMNSEGGRLQCKPTVWETYEDNSRVEYTPKDDMGGSILDPIGFALRVVLHQFQRFPARSLFILDEPMKNAGHGELLKQAGQMLAEISHSLGLQLIIITHEPELIDIADTAYTVSRNAKGESSIEQQRIS